MQQTVYVGDSIRCDIIAAHQRADLDTILVLEELVDAVSGKQELSCKVDEELDSEGNSGISIQSEPPRKRTKSMNLSLTKMVSNLHGTWVFHVANTRALLIYWGPFSTESL